jgi:hypothetical protein
LPSIKRCVAE